MNHDYFPEIKLILNSQRDRLYQSIKSVEEISDDFTTIIHATTSKCGPYVSIVGEVEQWRWLGVLIACLIVLLIWIILVSAVVCANCGCESRVAPSLYSAVGLLVIFILGKGLFSWKEECFIHSSRFDLKNL